MTTTDPRTEAAVDQLTRLVAVANNVLDSLRLDVGTAEPDHVTVARVVVLAHDTADQLVRLGAECYP